MPTEREDQQREHEARYVRNGILPKIWTRQTGFGSSALAGYYHISIGHAATDAASSSGVVKWVKLNPLQVDSVLVTEAWFKKDWP